MSCIKLANFSPGRVIIASLFCTILIGALLLSFPFASAHYISFVDLFFTATSLTCVTGLFTIPLTHFSFGGQLILLFLMQIGGLGIITMTLLFMYLIADLGLGTQLMASQLLEIDSWPHIKRLLIFIVLLTFVVECSGALLLFPVFFSDHSFGQAFLLAIFHAVSVFCNAGVWLLDQNAISHYSTSMLMPLIMIMLIFISDIGFMTWYEISTYFWPVDPKKKLHHLSLQSRIVFHATFLIVGLSSVLFLLLEWNHALKDFSWMQKYILSLFHGNSMRSTGLLLAHHDQLHPATGLIAMISGFIGAAPLSTGSGVKITTVAVFLAMIRSVINGRFAVEIKNRTIPIEQAQKAVAIIFLSVFWIIISTFLLLLTESQWPLGALLYETTMAFTNVGINTGITANLSTLGKLIIMSDMIIGRIGSVTLLLAILKSKNRRVVDFSYPEERVTLG